MMKKFTSLTIMVFALGLITTSFLACEPKTESQSAVIKDTLKNENLEDFAFHVPRPDNWEVADRTNALIVLKGLKAFEEARFDDASTAFADSIYVETDGFKGKVSNASLKDMLTSIWKKSVKIEINELSTLNSKDKSEEWVLVWYTESWDTDSGKKEVVDFMDCFQVKDGKIVVFTEYRRKVN